MERWISTMKFSIKIDDKSVRDEIKKIKKGMEEEVDVGWFESQGDHPTTDGEMTYPELAKYHAVGGQGKVTPRDVLAVTMAVWGEHISSDVEASLNRWVQNPTKSNLDKFLNKAGGDLAKKVRGLFATSYLSPTDNNPDPLVETGELRDKTAWRTSISKTVREV